MRRRLDSRAGGRDHLLPCGRAREGAGGCAVASNDEVTQGEESAHSSRTTNFSKTRKAAKRFRRATLNANDEVTQGEESDEAIQERDGTFAFVSNDEFLQDEKSGEAISACDLERPFDRDHFEIGLFNRFANGFFTCPFVCRDHLDVTALDIHRGAYDTR